MPEIATIWDSLGADEDKDYGWDWTDILDGDTIATAGTLKDTTPAIDGAVPAGATTMNLDGGAATETIVAGELFRVAGVGGLYRFTSAYAAVGGAITGAAFTPEAPAGGFPNDALLTMDTALWGLSQLAIDNGLELHTDTLVGVVSSVWIRAVAGTDLDALVAGSPYQVVGGIASTGGRALRKPFLLKVSPIV